MLSLNMMSSRSEHPEDPELEYFSGQYRVESSEPADMALFYVSGEILTLDMEETGKASFVEKTL